LGWETHANVKGKVGGGWEMHTKVKEILAKRREKEKRKHREGGK
jgi:hypothetical protein